MSSRRGRRWRRSCARGKAVRAGGASRRAAPVCTGGAGACGRGPRACARGSVDAGSAGAGATPRRRGNTHKLCPALVPAVFLRRDPAWLCGGGMVIAASGRGRGAGAQRGVGRTGRRWVATLPYESGEAHLKCALPIEEGFLPRRPPSSECFAAMRRRRPPVTLPMSVWRGRGVVAAGVRALVGGVVGVGRAKGDGEGGKIFGGVGRLGFVRALVVRMDLCSQSAGLKS
jgi:hypothetical protein